MRIDPVRIKALCRRQGISLNELLKRSGVSKTAYYSLTRRGIVIPKSLLRLCKTLGTEATALLDSLDKEAIKDLVLKEELSLLLRRYTSANRENLWHTLLLLEENPVNRLNRALKRSSHVNIY